MLFDQDELRIMSMSAHVFIKMLREREAKVLNKLYGDYRNGKTDFLALVAEFAIIREQILEISRSLTQHEQELSDASSRNS